MVTAAEIRERLKDYDIAQTTVSHFADVTTAQLSRWLNGLTDLSDAEKERIETASSALASMIHDMYEIPIDLRRVEKLEPVVRKYMQNHRLYIRWHEEHPDTE